MRATILAMAAAAAALALAGGAQARIVHDGGCASGFSLVNGAQRTCVDPQRIVHDARCNGPAAMVDGVAQCLASDDPLPAPPPPPQPDPAPPPADGEDAPNPPGLDTVLPQAAKQCTASGVAVGQTCVEPERIVHDDDPACAPLQMAVAAADDVYCLSQRESDAIKRYLVSARFVKVAKATCGAELAVTHPPDRATFCVKQERIVHDSSCEGPKQLAALVYGAVLCIPGSQQPIVYPSSRKVRGHYRKRRHALPYRTAAAESERG